MITTDWLNCYPSNWKGVIVPEAMAHPAKYSSKLIRRIYEHMVEQGWVQAGDRVLDPFGGVALGALDAMRLGLHWTGIELEAKFAGLGTVNILEWNNRFGNMPRWGSARLFNGDSRKLCEILYGETMAQAAVSSPPYSDMDLTYKRNGFDAAVSSPPYNPPMSQDHNGSKGGQRGTTPSEPGAFVRYGNTPGQLEGVGMDGFDAAISSPPFLQSEGGTPEPKPGGAIDDRLYARHAAGNKSSHAYGETDGQLSSMKETVNSWQCAVSSPPFGVQQSGQGIAAAMRGESNYSLPNNHTGKHGYQEQAETPGNLASMPATGYEAAISSPPYNETDQNYKAGWERFHKTREPLNAKDIQREAEYGSTEGQLSTANDFWLAARTIVEQVYLALAPGGHAVWVVKDYVKNKQIVPFCDQWRQLCEAVGFIALHEHHAMLVHHNGAQHTLDGGLHEYKTESKSFFRRLAEKKGSPRIDYETVFCMEKK